LLVENNVRRDTDSVSSRSSPIPEPDPDQNSDPDPDPDPTSLIVGGAVLYQKPHGGMIEFWWEKKGDLPDYNLVVHEQHC
jgi:hypothetical protein